MILDFMSLMAFVLEVFGLSKKTLKISELGFELLQNITTFADP